MIFVTTGTQLPFNRLVNAVFALANQYPHKAFVMQASFDRSYDQTIPSNVQLLESVSPVSFTQYLEESELIISHAGVGSIVSAARLGKVMILFPRKGKLKEHRNDHQVATCNMLQKTYPLHVAMNAEELSCLVEQHYATGLTPMQQIGEHASPELIGSLKSFIIGEDPLLKLNMVR